ncbi:phospholipase [Flavobacterium sp. Sd200]|uniref:phospholipase A n=1 Tax=Flavobacterium sp. Sd200 TaxID=2692211 RepID=UPI001369AE3D|nr:phospholipase A [Flavobacterium sp. Sd200]MXN89784.1 phospholipase [Flavobacterium sp. Sd200]
MYYKKNLCLLSFLLLMTSVAGAQVSSAFNNNRQRSMAQRWELDTLTSAGTFVFTPYKPIYILPFRWSSQPNDRPYSGNPSEGYVIPEGQDFNNIEAKFQISFKVKILQTIFGRYGDLWVAYTQKSHWQVYTSSLSRPFRETNYEPEVILNFATNLKMFGFTNRMTGVSFNHQSNGRPMPLSRSWNRIIFHAGFTKNNWQVYLRPWIRLPDDAKGDDNPDIVDRIGRGDVTVTYSMGRSDLSFIGSSNFSFNRHFSGYAEAAWSYRLFGNLKAYLQLTHGYGETLIDYNNRQTTIGLGVSLIEWN